MSTLANLSHSGRIGTLTLNRPDARNSISLEMLDALSTRMSELEKRDDLSVLILTGEGKAFCAGMDLKAVLSDAALPLKLLSGLATFCHRLRQLPMVTLARVNGAAIGGGCGLATVCDIAITHADSKMGFPEVDLGVCPAVVAPWLVRKVGAGRARHILLSGGLMSGQRAFEVGIVNQVVPTRDDLDKAVEEAAARLATGGPNALRATKALLNELDGSQDQEMGKRAAELSARVLATPEARAMLAAKMKG